MPSGPSTGVPDVIVCAAVSLFSQVTVSPASIVTGFGMKQFGSHPGAVSYTHLTLPTNREV